MRKAKQNMAVSLYLLMLASVTLVGVTYAWLQITGIPEVDTLGLEVLTDTDLQIAPDAGGVPGEWSGELDISSDMSRSSALKPITYVQEQDRFYAAGYGMDGRPQYSTMIAMTDTENGSPVDSPENHYYTATTFWVRSQGSDGRVMLSREGQEGQAGTWLIGSSADGDAVAGEAAVRMGFRIINTDENGRELGQERFIIYEPNADQHIDGTVGYVETIGADGGTYCNPDDLFIQNASAYSGTFGTGAAVVPGEFENQDLGMFYIRAGEMKKIVLYLWAEGQDVDCRNSSVDVELAGNISFTAEALAREDEIIAR